MKTLEKTETANEIAKELARKGQLTEIKKVYRSSSGKKKKKKAKPEDDLGFLAKCFYFWEMLWR